MSSSCVQDQIEKRDMEFLEKIIKDGFHIFSSKYEKEKSGNHESSSFVGAAVGETVSAVVTTAAICVGGGSSAKTAGDKAQSISDKASNTIESVKCDEKQKFISSWTNPSGEDNEPQFLDTAVEGLAYICVAFKDQIKMFHPTKENKEAFFSDVYQRVFDYMETHINEGTSPLTPEDFFNAFIEGRSTYHNIFKQTLAKIKSRGMNLTDKHSQKLINTQKLIEKPGHIILQGNQQFSLYVQKIKKNYKFEAKDIRLRYNFEKSNLPAEKLNASEYQVIYSEIKNDWRLNIENVITYIKNASRKVRKIFSETWWPEKKCLPKIFYKRESCKLYIQSSLSADNCARIIILTGGGGVGKIALALWFALEYENNYDHVIYFDCGVGNLNLQFKELALKLKLDIQNETAVNILAKCCFERLNYFKCLWIYDNAKCLHGEEGIEKVLAQTSFHNFHVIVTSRNQEWKDSITLKEIPQFSVSLLDEIEAIEIISQNIHNFGEKQCRKLELFKLCNLLGYLPLALQIAIATINQYKLSVHDYCIRITKTDGLIESVFHAYGKSINKTLSVSLDLIKSVEGSSNNLANNILNIFGYIRADNIPIEFFTHLEKHLHFENIKEAAELLQKYSLVTISIRNESLSQTKTVLSIHRLLQQVIRYNGKETKNATIKQILKCEGFLEYKLLPHCFADEELRKEFPEIKSELIEKLNLQSLLRERRFEEAVELSRLIKESISSLSTLYNYAYCLKQNYEITEAQQIFKDLYDKASNIIYNGPYTTGIVSMTEIVHGKLVGGQLMKMYLESGFIEEAIEIIRNSGGVFECGDESLNDILKLFTSIPNCAFKYDGITNCFSVTDQKEKNGNIFELSNCFVDKETFPLSNSPIYELSLKTLTNTPDFLKNILLPQVHKLSLIDMTIDLSFEFTAEVVSLENVTAKEWTKTKWIVNTLILNKIGFAEKTEMKIKELIVYNSIVDVSVFPSTLQKISLVGTLVNCTLDFNNSLLINFSSGNELKELNLTDVEFIDRNGSNIIISSKIDLSSSFLHLVTLRKLILKNNSEAYTYPWKISMDCLKSIQNLELFNCIVVSSPTYFISAEMISLGNVFFIRDSNEFPMMKEDVPIKCICWEIVEMLKFSGLNSVVTLTDESELETIRNYNFRNMQTRLEKIMQKPNVSELRWPQYEKNCIRYASFQQTELMMEELADIGCDARFKVSFVSKFQSLNKLELMDCLILNSSQNFVDTWKLPNSLNHLIIDRVIFANKDRHTMHIDISSLIGPSIQSLKISSNVSVNTKRLGDIPYLKMKNCNLIVNHNHTILRPIELRLEKVSILGHMPIFAGILPFTLHLHDIVDFSRMKKLYIDGDKLLLNMNQNVSVSEVTLINTNVNLEDIKWTIDELHIPYTVLPFPALDISHPPSVTSVYLYFQPEPDDFNDVYRG